MYDRFYKLFYNLFDFFGNYFCYRKVNERDVSKATISRYSSDDTLDR